MELSRSIRRAANPVTLPRISKMALIEISKYLNFGLSKRIQYVNEKKKKFGKNKTFGISQKIMTPAWFEHAHLTITELESAALDRSATEPYWKLSLHSNNIQNYNLNFCSNGALGGDTRIQHTERRLLKLTLTPQPKIWCKSVLCGRRISIFTGLLLISA